MAVKKYFVFVFALFLVECVSAQSRHIINIPDLPGYTTLKCDFHMHTVFSDGTVWPTERVKEAWFEGLDAISITDHIEYRPHSKDVVADHNRSFDIAEPLARQMDIILIKGAEITRSMPPGHLNALFITNTNLLDRQDVNEALKEARAQGAFIFWNHPGWKKQQPETTKWWPEHTSYLKNDLLHGIEVYNSTEFYPEAIDWANQKKLTVLCNSDVHGPMNTNGGHRPITLVFAKSRTAGGIKEALFAGRTLAYFGNTLVGKTEFLEPLFFNSLEYTSEALEIKNEESKIVYIRNNSDIDYELELVQPGLGFDVPEALVLKAHQITPLEISGNSNEVEQATSLNVYYRVKNLKISSDENLIATFSFKNN